MKRNFIKAKSTALRLLLLIIILLSLLMVIMSFFSNLKNTIKYHKSINNNIRLEKNVKKSKYHGLLEFLSNKTDISSDKTKKLDKSSGNNEQKLETNTMNKLYGLLFHKSQINNIDNQKQRNEISQINNIDNQKQQSEIEKHKYYQKLSNPINGTNQQTSNSKEQSQDNIKSDIIDKNRLAITNKKELAEHYGQIYDNKDHKINIVAIAGERAITSYELDQYYKIIMMTHKFNPKNEIEEAQIKQLCLQQLIQDYVKESYLNRVKLPLKQIDIDNGIIKTSESFNMGGKNIKATCNKIQKEAGIDCMVLGFSVSVGMQWNYISHYNTMKNIKVSREEIRRRAESKNMDISDENNRKILEGEIRNEKGEIENRILLQKLRKAMYIEIIGEE